MQTAFLSKNETSCIKGILVCMVLISHLSARVELFSTSLLGTMFGAFGYLAVSAFFFLSAFGLYERYAQSGRAYLVAFPVKKLLPFYAMCCLTILIYLVRDLVLTGTTDWPVFAQSFLFGKTTVDMGWYLQAQLILYVIFFLVFRFMKKGQLLFVALAIGVYCVLCAVAGLAETWYESVLCFAFGLMCAKYKKQILAFFPGWGRWIAVGAGFGILFLITLFFGNKPLLPSPLRIGIKMVSAILFNCLMVTFVARVNMKNPVAEFLGKRSFEIYVLQGMFMYGYRSIITNDWLYMCAVLVSVIPLSIAAHPLFRLVGKGISSIWDKKQGGKE